MLLSCHRTEIEIFPIYSTYFLPYRHLIVDLDLYSFLSLRFFLFWCLFSFDLFDSISLFIRYFLHVLFQISKHNCIFCTQNTFTTRFLAFIVWANRKRKGGSKKDQGRMEEREKRNEEWTETYGKRMVRRHFTDLTVWLKGPLPWCSRLPLPLSSSGSQYFYPVVFIHIVLLCALLSTVCVFLSHVARGCLI